MFGLYLFVTGVPRQALTMFSTLGTCSSYPTIAGSISTRPTLPTPSPATNTIQPEELTDTDDEDPDWDPEADEAEPTLSEDEDEDELENELEEGDELEDLLAHNWHLEGMDEVGAFDVLATLSELEDDNQAGADEHDSEHIPPNAWNEAEDGAAHTEGVDTADSSVQEIVPAEQIMAQRQESATNEPPSLQALETIVDTDARAVPELEAPVPLLKRGTGLIRRLCESCRITTRATAMSALCGSVYDNINFMFRTAEQIIGRKDTQENGTCATIFPLFDARPEDMQTSDLLKAHDEAPLLASDDILHTADEAILFRKSLEHAVLRVLVHDYPTFARFQKEAQASLPGTDDQIPLHKTELYPLPAMQIDESTITGNAEVMDAIFKEVGFEIGTTKFTGIVRPVFGDQLSIARLRALMTTRAGHETTGNAYANTVFGPGLFHHQMTLVIALMQLYFGDATTGLSNPASLVFLNTVLDRKPIVLTSLPPYRVCRDLLLNILSAAVPVCLLEVADADDIEDYAANVTFEELQQHITHMLNAKADSNLVAALRCQRSDELEDRAQNLPSQIADKSSDGAASHPQDQPTVPAAPSADNEPNLNGLKTGDMVFENCSLMLRDLLILREFTDAIKGGYSGRIIRVLKVLALMYRGSGHTKYAHELLHLLHNLTHIWPKPLRYVHFDDSFHLYVAHFSQRHHDQELAGKPDREAELVGARRLDARAYELLGEGE